ncbi:MAG: sodium/glutamate symporter, partial [Pseudomonadota bacterium]|nr:sodium/glutamate symporter [Pseudomonadota bacterium]
MAGETITLTEFVSFNLAILVYFLGVRLNKKILVLDRFSIPEPVSGGLLVAFLSLVVYLGLGTEIGFSLQSRDYLLYCFFTAIGLNARFTDLAKGGKPLLILLMLTVCYMLLQNAVGSGIAAALGLPTGFGLLGGTISLVGGHGTAIAWGPKLATDYGVPGAVEIGAATATLGLIAASLLGGPVGKFLIEKRGGKPDPNRPEEAPMIGLEMEREADTSVTHTGLMRSLLVLNIAIGLGVALQEALSAGIGLDLPVFVCCLFCGIVLSNTVPLVFPKMTWPARSKSLAVLSDLALGIFLTMSLMSLQLWTIAGLAGPMLLILFTQV